MNDPTKNQSARISPVSSTHYQVPTPAQRELGLWVHGVGSSSAKLPSCEPWRRVLGEYAAVYVSRGEGWFQSAPTGKVAVKAGTLIWLFPSVEHSYSPEPGTWAEQWVIFGGSVAAEFEKQGYLHPARPLVCVGEDPEFNALFGRLQSVFVKGGPLAVPLAAAVAQQLVVYAHGVQTGLWGAGLAVDPAVAEALRIIEAEAVRGIDPEDLAARVRTGYSTLRRRFRAITGSSIKEYVLSVQLKKAKELLAFSQLSVEEIAAEAGFDDPFYFSRLFRKREGLPPSAFRERQARMR